MKGSDHSEDLLHRWDNDVGIDLKEIVWCGLDSFGSG